MVTKSQIEMVTDLLQPVAERHNTVSEMYWVTESAEGRKIDDEVMNEHGSMEEYCEDCIDAAVVKKHKEWSIDRNVLMGQIYEAEKKGFYTYFGFSNARGSKYVFRKVKVTPKQIEGMKRKLKTQFRIGHKFSKAGIQLCSYEAEGFRHCEGCGKMFLTSLLLNEQELEHWEGLQDAAYENIEPSEAYQLIDILSEGGHESHELNDRVKKLAERILKLIAA